MTFTDVPQMMGFQAYEIYILYK